MEVYLGLVVEVVGECVVKLLEFCQTTVDTLNIWFSIGCWNSRNSRKEIVVKQLLINIWISCLCPQQRHLVILLQLSKIIVFLPFQHFSRSFLLNLLKIKHEPYSYLLYSHSSKPFSGFSDS